MKEKTLILVTTASIETLLTPVDGRERAAVLFIAGVSETRDTVELLCPRIYTPLDYEYAAREPWLCVLKADAIIANVLVPLGAEQGVVHVHDHGTGMARFSGIDNRGLDDKLVTVRTRRESAWFVRGVVGRDGIWLEAYSPGSTTPVAVDRIKVITPSNGFVWVRPINSRLERRAERQIDHEVHDRTIALLGKDAERVLGALTDTRVGVIGVGGVGSAVCSLLPCLGVSKITLVDDDRLERSNLNRWILHRAGDEGQAKVLVARRRLLEAHPDLRVDAVEALFPSPEAEASLKECDLLFCSPDNSWTRHWADRFAARFMKVCLSMGSGVDVGPDGLRALGAQLRCFVPSAGGRCAACQGMNIDDLSPPALERQHRQTGYTIAGSVVTINSAIASVATGWLFGWFRGRSGSMPTCLQYDELNFSIDDLSRVFQPNPECPICGITQTSMLGRGDTTSDADGILTSPDMMEATYGAVD